MYHIPLISIIKEIAITSELIRINRLNQFIQRVKTVIFTLYPIKLNMASIKGHWENIQPVCCEASVVCHCCQQHKFFLVGLPNHVLVPCIPDP